MELKRRVEASEEEVQGVESSLEELRAIGRMEASQDFMRTVFNTLVCSSATFVCNGCASITLWANTIMKNCVMCTLSAERV